MALTIPENFIDTVDRTRLSRDHPPRLHTKLLLIGRVEQFAIPLVTGTSFGIAAISTLAECAPLTLLDIINDVVIKSHVLLDILNAKVTHKNLRSKQCHCSQSCRA